MKKIFICSPLKGNIKENIEKAKEYSREVVLAGHIPITPHIYFTQFLNDGGQKEGEIGTNYYSKQESLFSTSRKIQKIYGLYEQFKK